MPYKFIEHTADIAVEVEEDSLEKLFASACNAWRDAALINKKPDNTGSKKFIFTSGSLEELLVELLSELNFQLYAKKWIYISVKNILLEKFNSNYHLAAEVFGQPLEQSSVELKEEIKAVTFHQMNIEKNGENFFTRIVFDI
ncbi:MAG: archease [Ignavibacteriales bacterium]|nr:archease [Ignavibacteriales bacterium]